ncbi:MAG: hypothetical protein K2X39_00240 [Silvanigrellaceae bacterium]|nr:hypothetical protein [Silvanigrellaceae bacterium]
MQDNNRLILSIIFQGDLNMSSVQNKKLKEIEKAFSKAKKKNNLSNSNNANRGAYVR